MLKLLALPIMNLKPNKLFYILNIIYKFCKILFLIIPFLETCLEQGNIIIAKLKKSYRLFFYNI